MHALRIGATLAGLAVLPHADALAQAQSADDLINRIREIQAAQTESPQPPGQPAAQAQSAEELIDRIKQMRSELGPEPAPPQPELAEDEIRAMVRDSLGVEILRVEVVEHEGAPAYAITVMNPGGDRNDAFQVATLLFDGATGALLEQQPTGPRVAAPAAATVPPPHGFEGSGPEIRRRTWR